MEERLVRVVGSETNFAVMVPGDPPEPETQKSRECGHQILAMASEGNPREDLRHAHSWKNATPGLKALLLGMPERNEDLLFYARGGVSGFFADRRDG